MAGKISEMDATAAMTAGTLFEGSRAGVTEKVSGQQMVTYFAGAFTAQAKLIGDVTAAPFNARGDGVADDLQAFLDCAADLATRGGGSIYMPRGRYKLSSMFDLDAINAAIPPIGSGTSAIFPSVGLYGDGMHNSRIQGQTITNTPIVKFSAIAGAYLHDFGIDGPSSVNAGQSSTGIRIANTDRITLRNISTFGCAVGIDTRFCSSITLDHCNAREARQFNLMMLGNDINNSLGTAILNCLFQVANPSGNAFTEPANIYLDGINGVLIDGCVVDELGLNFNIGGSSVLFGDVYPTRDVELHRCQVFGAGTPQPSGQPYYGIHMKAQAIRPKLNGVHVRPYTISPERVPTNTIKIDAGVQDAVLEDVTTVPNGGGDISDAGANTIWRNVNGQNKNRAGVITAA